MTPEQRARAIVHNAADRALSSRGHWVPLSVRVAIAETVLAALAEQGMVIVSAEDLRAVVGETRSYESYTAALPRLRAVLSGTAPQPSETPQDAQTGDGGISGRSDTPDASTGLSDARADDLRRRYAEALIARIKQSVIIPGPPGDWHAFGPSEYDLADSVLAVRDTELETVRRELEAARAGFTAPDDIVYNLVWVAARNEHTRSWLASKGLVVMQREAFDKELADLHRKRGEAEARAEQAAAKLDRFRTFLDTNFRFWCSPRGVAGQYAKDLLEILDRDPS